MLCGCHCDYFGLVRTAAPPPDFYYSLQAILEVAAGQADGLFFLTALPSDYSMPYAASDKMWWAHEHFPDVTVFLGPFSHDKWRHCKPGDILIDDRTSNCNEWTRAGGQAHIYRTWQACAPWLNQIINSVKENQHHDD
jgi:hypothetical protein